MKERSKHTVSLQNTVLPTKISITSKMFVSTVISFFFFLSSFQTIAFHNSCHQQFAVTTTKIHLAPELIPLLEFVMAPVVLSAVLVQQKNEVNGLRNQVAALAKESNSTSSFNPFIEEFRKELQSSLENTVSNSGAAATSTELLAEVQVLNARLINLEKRLDKIGSESDSSVVSSNTMQARVALLEDTIKNVENSLGTLQEADEQSLTLQQLIVGDINSLKTIVAGKSTNVDNPTGKEQPALIELERRVDELSTLVSGDAALLKSTLTSLSLDLDDSIEGMQNRLENQMQQKMGDLKDKVTLLAAKVDVGDADNAEAFNALLDERLASTRETIAHDLLDNVSSSLADSEERTTRQIEELATRLMLETQRTEESVSTATAAIKLEVNDKMREIDTALDLVEKEKEELSRRLDEVDQSLEIRAEAVAVRVSTWSRVKRTAVGVVRGTVGVVKKPFVGMKNFITGPVSSSDSNGGDGSSSTANKNTKIRRSDQRISARINDEE